MKIVNALDKINSLLADALMEADADWEDTDEYDRELGLQDELICSRASLRVALKRTAEAINALKNVEEDYLKDFTPPPDEKALAEERLAADVAMLEGPAWQEPSND